MNPRRKSEISRSTNFKPPQIALVFEGKWDIQGKERQSNTDPIPCYLDFGVTGSY